ncbi:MAG TPA: metal-sulfur cluster biosynthetic enzyme, partial [Acidimicrobiaceae bacterium]|nr:metal-sulfur cluster biosynthetic enzyme [Acidimicrobiaceae bacterium]
MDEKVTSPASSPSEADVMGVLRGVIDPELGTDIVELGMA